MAVVRYLINTTEKYKVDSEYEAAQLINEFKEDEGTYHIVDYKVTEKYDKGLDCEYFIVTVKKVFNTNEKQIENRNVPYYNLPDAMEGNYE